MVFPVQSVVGYSGVTKNCEWKNEGMKPNMISPKEAILAIRSIVCGRVLQSLFDGYRDVEVAGNGKYLQRQGEECSIYTYLRDLYVDFDSDE